MRNFIVVMLAVLVLASCDKSEQRCLEEIAVHQMDSISNEKGVKYRPVSFSQFYAIAPDGKTDLNSLVGEAKAMEYAYKVFHFLEGEGNVYALLEDAKELDSIFHVAKAKAGAYYAVHECRIKDKGDDSFTQVPIGVVIYPDSSPFRKIADKPMTVITNK